MAAKETQLPTQLPDDPPAQDGMSSFTVWSRTTRLDDEDDADLSENNVVLRGID